MDWITYSDLVIFRLVVFRPFASEVILAKVKSSDEDGIRREYLAAPFCMLLLTNIHLSNIGFLRRYLRSLGVST